MTCEFNLGYSDIVDIKTIRVKGRSKNTEHIPKVKENKKKKHYTLKYSAVIINLITHLGYESKNGEHD